MATEIRERVERLPSGAERPAFDLAINGVVLATAALNQGQPELRWQVYGPQAWPVAHEFLQGLLELGVICDQLAVKPRRGA